MSSTAVIKSQVFKLESLVQSEGINEDIRLLSAEILEENDYLWTPSDSSYFTLCWCQRIPVRYDFRIPPNLLDTKVKQLLVDMLPDDYFSFSCGIVSRENTWCQNVSVQSYLYRLVCTSRLILPNTYNHFSFYSSEYKKTQEIVASFEKVMRSTCKPKECINDLLKKTFLLRIRGLHSLLLYRQFKNELKVKNAEMLKLKKQSTNNTYYDIINEITSLVLAVNNPILQQYFQMLGGELTKMIIKRN